MSNMWSSIWTGVAADAIYTVFAAVVASSLALLLVGRHRRHLFQFFGIDDRDSKVKVYLSRVDVLPGGSKGTDGKLKHGFSGPALVGLEYQGALAVMQLLQSPLLKTVPSVFKEFIEGRAGHLRAVTVSIDASPGSDEYRYIFEQSTDVVVLLGSDVYSHAVRTVYEGPRSFVKFVSETSGLPFHGDDLSYGEPTFAVCVEGIRCAIPARSIGREIASVQRVTLETGRRLLMCAGLSASTTYASTRYLCSHWQSLANRFGADDFLVVLESPKQKADNEQLEKLSELPEYERRRKVSEAPL